MSVKIDVVVDNMRAALAVPDSALVYRDGKPGVMVRGDGWQAVTLAWASGAVSGSVAIFLDGQQRWRPANPSTLGTKVKRSGQLTFGRCSGLSLSPISS